EATDAARDQLHVFKRELADLGIRAKLKLDLGLEIQELSGLSRTVFGSYLLRSATNSEMASAKEEIEAISEKVERLVEDVEAGLKTVKSRLADLNAERVRILEEA